MAVSRADGVRRLQVKTLGPSHPDAGYARTRHFCEECGVLPLEEADLWGDDHPCLFMRMPLSGSKGSTAWAGVIRHAHRCRNSVEFGLNVCLGLIALRAPHRSS